MAVITSAAFTCCNAGLENESPHLLDVAAVVVTLSPQKWREVTGGHLSPLAYWVRVYACIDNLLLISQGRIA